MRPGSMGGHDGSMGEALATNAALRNSERAYPPIGRIRDIT